VITVITLATLTLYNNQEQMKSAQALQGRMLSNTRFTILIDALRVERATSCTHIMTTTVGDDQRTWSDVLTNRVKVEAALANMITNVDWTLEQRNNVINDISDARITVENAGGSLLSCEGVMK
jgi:hypothetical protein